MKGKIVLIPFPFTDLKAVKLRPALVVHEGNQDVVIVFISSKVPTRISDADVPITTNAPGFGKTGLKVDSVLKLDKIATVMKNLIVGELGELDPDLRREVNKKLGKILQI